MDPLAALLSERPPQQPSLGFATELHFRIVLLEEAARACRAERECGVWRAAPRGWTRREPPCTRRAPAWIRAGGRWSRTRARGGEESEEGEQGEEVDEPYQGGACCFRC